MVNSLLTEIKDRSTVTYTDSNVQAGEQYYYKITAVDKFLQESNPSSIVNVTATPDVTIPVILGISPVDSTVIGSSTKVVVRAEDNVLLAEIRLQYSMGDSGEWQDLQVLKTKDYAKFNWDTSLLNGLVKVRAIAKDSSGNESDGSVIRTYTLDNLGPAKITGVTMVPYTTSVLLNWNDVPDLDFAYFQVEKKDSLEGPFTKVGTVSNKRGMLVTGLRGSTPYWFKVVAYDRYGNRGTESDEVNISTLSDTAIPVITKIKPLPGSYSSIIPLKVSAKDDVGVTSIMLQYSSDGTNWTEMARVAPSSIASSVTVSYDFDVTGLPDGLYSIRGIAVDTSGNSKEVTDSSSMIQYRVDHTAPAKPEGLKVVPGDGSLELDWIKGTEEDLKVYKVYRSTSAMGQYTLVDGAVMTQGYRDRSVQFGTSYYYKISAADISGLESEFSDAASGTLLEDHESPSIVSIFPNANTMLPANPKVNVLASDGYKLSKVSLYYKKKNDMTDSWITVGEQTLDVYSKVLKFTWNTKGLSNDTYTIKALAVDQSGNVSDPFTVDYSLNVEPPAAPVLEVTSGGWKVDLTWSSNNEADLAGFRIYRSTAGGAYNKIKETKATEYSDTTVTPGVNYYYKVEAVDIYGNSNWSTEKNVTPISEDTVVPVAEAGYNQVTAVGMEVAFDGSRSKDNDRIDKYLWDFGDGTTSDLAQPRHAYTESGIYAATLKVSDPSGNSGSDSVTVTVNAPQETGSIEMKVIDNSSGVSLSNATVFVQYPDGTSSKTNTDSSGKVTIVGGAGEYKISAYKPDYKPASIIVALDVNATKSEIIALEYGKIVIGSLAVKRMTLDEIKAAGINPSLPSNQFVYKYTVKLTFNGDPLPPEETIVSGSGLVYSLGKFRINDWQVVPHVIPHPKHPEVSPTIFYMVIPGGASWLKEYFEVSLLLENTADAEFVLNNCSAELKLPSALKFVPTSDSESLKVDLGSIEGKQSKQVKWVISGETKGSYDLEAEFNGTLMPFEEPVKSIFRTSEPFRVWGTDALHMYIEQEDFAYAGQNYHVRIGLKNVSSETVYNMNLSMNEGEGYTLSEDQQQSISVEQLTPGETLWIDCKLLAERTGQLVLAELIVMGSAQIPTTITTKPAPLKVYSTYVNAKPYDGSYHFHGTTVVENLKNYDAINVNAQISVEPSSGVTLSGGGTQTVEKIEAFGGKWYINWGVDIASQVNLDTTKVKIVVNADNAGEIEIAESLASVKEKMGPILGKDIPWIRFVSDNPEINKELDIQVVFEGIQSLEVTISDPDGNNQHLNLSQSTEGYYSYLYTPSKTGNYTITAVANGDPAKKATKYFNINVETIVYRPASDLISPVWKTSDENYSDLVQTMLLELNFDWYFATTQQERGAFVQKADDIRADVADGIEWWLDQAKQLTEAAANEFSWFLGGSVSTNERNEWLALNQIFQEDLVINDTGGRETGMFVAGLLVGGEGSIFKNGVRSWIKRNIKNEIKKDLSKIAWKKLQAQ